MNPENMLSRREALKFLGAGAALLGWPALNSKAAVATLNPNAAVSGRTVSEYLIADTPQPFTLPKLGYAYDALEPQIDARTMGIHYSMHHQAYIANANKALVSHPELQKLTGEEILANLGAIPEPLRTTLRNNVGGHVNHSFFWKIIAPGGGGAPGGALGAAIDGTFGSLAAFQRQFNETAAKRFGSGWAWLSAEKGGKLRLHSSANQDSPLSDGARPVLGIDVWEHAYYLKYQNRRPEYAAAFWKVVNWRQADANHALASA
jgi:superoxide dismutase, Fe-Mn family